MARSLIGAAMALFASTGIALLGAGGTYALLTSSAASTPATVITAATASLTTTQPGDFSLLAPGRTISRPVTITNTGDIPLIVGVDSATFTGTLASVATVQVTDSSTCTGGNVMWSRTPSATTTIATPDLPAGWSATMCLTVTVDANAPASTEGGTLAMSLVLSGRQQ